VVGARPQFIKAAVVSRLIRSGQYQEKIRECLVHTGQHYDDNMSAVFFREMEIPEPDINLQIGSGTHGAMTGAMLARLEKVMMEQKPDVVLVYGDTNSTLAGALAASKLHIPVVHVEAGLRSFMMAMPEEQNRIIADKLSTVLFCPTEAAIHNLVHEGIQFAQPALPSADQKAVFLSGDVMLDASLYYRQKQEAMPLSSVLASLVEKPFYLATLHRAENTDDPARLAAIVKTLNEFNAVPAILPLHPRTRKILSQQRLELAAHIHAIDPVGYFDMLALEDRCQFVVTDSGGVQKEAYFFGKPCITLRDSTEWIELVQHGWNTLVGANTKKILAALKSMPRYGESVQLYGDGHASEFIVQTLLNIFVKEG
jgi:UDP-GlcNAc3NAcA epimerase